MSVLKSKRNLSDIEYLDAFINLLKQTEDRISRLPKRKMAWLGEPILTKLYEIQDDIIAINNDYYCHGIKLKSKPEQAQIVIDKILNIQKDLLILWNDERYETRKMVNWIGFFNTEIINLEKMGGVAHDSKNEMYILDYNEIHNARFLNKMSALDRFVHSKVVSLPRNLRYTSGRKIVDLADKAFYLLVEANRYIPTAKWQYENRKQKITEAMTCLKEMESPMFGLFLNMQYGNKTMIAWASLLEDETKLLSALLKSDKERFCNL